MKIARVTAAEHDEACTAMNYLLLTLGDLADNVRHLRIVDTPVDADEMVDAMAECVRDAQVLALRVAQLMLLDATP